MYHPGRVIEVFSTRDKNIESIDNTTQAMVEMWDDNLITVLVEPHLGDKVRKEDVVLVDYRPLPNVTVPRMTVVKVLKGTLARQAWTTYRDHFMKKNQRSTIPLTRAKTKQPYVG